MNCPSTVPLWIVGAFVLVAAAFDVWRFQIPNALTIPALLAGLAHHLWQGGWNGGAESAAGAALGAASLIALYALGAMGAGDVKLLAAVGAWLGAPAAFCVFVIAALAAGVYSAVILAGQGRLGRATLRAAAQLARLAACAGRLPVADRVEAVVRQSRPRTRLIPFAPMIAIGVFLLFWRAYCVMA